MSNQNPFDSTSADSDKPKPEARLRKRMRKKFLIIPGLLLLLALGYNAVRSWQAASAFESRLTRLREAGEPLTLDQLQREPLAKDDNALTRIRRTQPATDELSQRLLEYQSSDEFRLLRPNDEQLQMLRQVLAEHKETFELYARAAGCSRLQSDWRIGAQPSASLNSHLEETSLTRAMFRNWSTRAGLLLADGETEEALQQGLQMSSLSRSIEHQPLILAYLVALACRSTSLDVIAAVLERGSLTDQQRQQIDAALAACESVEGFKQALASERIYGLASFRTEIFGGTLGSVFLWKFKLDACNYLDLVDEMTVWTESPRHRIDDSLKTLQSQSFGPLTSLVIPAFIQVRTAHDRTLARVRCVRLLNALQLQHPGGISAAADEVELSKSTETPDDPFTGASLKVAVAEDAVAVYSAGTNGTDDGGKLDDQSDIGVRISR